MENLRSRKVSNKTTIDSGYFGGEHRGQVQFYQHSGQAEANNRNYQPDENGGNVPPDLPDAFPVDQEHVPVEDRAESTKYGLTIRLV
jgi:hypothetical protein